ncbi:PAS domain-containing protein [Dongia soli]|uniref:PAS domain-containing protein n=1 Tax=Dongia soli TaxID=600628 RepID=A0ABU5E7Q5_9PROT|nr:PAS domain-containing protein [Dongia soli]MDY0882206.1 PAS domain-containing protein [Dongia soli]
MQEAPSVANLNSAVLSGLDAYWRQQCAGRDMPRRADIDPIALKQILPRIILTRIEYAPLRILYTVVGTQCVASAGFDYTGYYLDELDMSAEVGTHWPAVYGRIIDERRPVFGVCGTALSNGQSRPYVAGLYPLSDENGEISHVIAIEDIVLEPTDELLMVPTQPIVLKPRQNGRVAS